MNGKNEFPIEIPCFEASETIDDVKINPYLDQEKQNQLLQLVTEFSDVLTDVPGRTNIIEHEIGIGAVLMQEHEGMKFPISYASRKLLSRDFRYSVIEKEVLALVWGIQKFKSYLYGRKFLLETDHQPLLYLNRAKVVNARLMR